MGHRSAFLILVLVLAAFFAPMLIRGDVIYPHDNSIELGLAPPEESDHISNRKFSDQSSYYVPEIHHHLTGARSGWLSTWNPHTELGRQSRHVFGLSKAFILTHLLALASNDAFRVYTWLTQIAVLLTGVFGYLWMRSLALHPAACLTGALGLSLGVFVTYWLTSVIYIWGVCWTLAVLWLINHFLERATLTRGLGIAFAVHALLLSGYPQQIVWHAYLVSGFTLLSLLRRPDPLKSKLRCAAQLSLAALLGLASAAPVYLDLALTAGNSLRPERDPQAFVAALHALPSWRDAAPFLTSIFDAFWVGNPIQRDYPLRFNGLSLTPLFSVLMLLSFVDGQWRRLWFWQGFTLLCLLMTVWPAAYFFGVRHFGLALSLWTPLASAYVPAVTLAAYAADHVLRAGVRDGRLGLFLAFLPFAAVLTTALSRHESIEPGFAAVGIVLFLAAVVFLRTRSAGLLIATAIMSVLLYGSFLVLARPPLEIRRTSPLVEMIRRETQGESRYAFVINRAIPSNQEAMLGLRSIHTYNTLASRSYRDWVARVSNAGPAGYFGGQFRAIVPAARLDSDELRLAGVRLVASPRQLDPAIAELIGWYARLRLYRLHSPLLEAQFRVYEPIRQGHVRVDPLAPEDVLLETKKTRDQGDRLRFRTTPTDRPTLLFSSQQYHPHWKAFVDGRELQVVQVNEFYLGVVLPPHTEEIELRFLPWARWSWLPQLFFVLTGPLCWIYEGRRQGI
jgi:hypothetical protein